MSITDRYGKRGVSAGKEEVHAAIRHLDKGLFPNAFCKIIPDMAGGDPGFCNMMHADTAGTKTSLAYLYWKETGDMEVWKGIVQDAIVMNLDDMACAGCTSGVVLSSTIGRNKNLVPGEVLAALIQGTSHFIEEMAQWGVDIVLSGGETADVGDIVRTLDVGFTAFARMPREAVVQNDILDGDLIIGLASFGQAVYEQAYNSGIGSNGLTSARHDVLSKEYMLRYPETFDPQTPAELVYSGTKKLQDLVQTPAGPLPVGKLLLSPTRTYLPFLRRLLKTHRSEIHGLIHCTGGAQSKVLKFLRGQAAIKDNLFDPPPLFGLIQQESGASWEEMYRVFNMGHRLEVYTHQEMAGEVIALAASFGIEAAIIGRVVQAPENRVIVQTGNGIFEYV
jgi:phosphoribosylformylglycinamidine cyclo-ligase